MNCVYKVNIKNNDNHNKITNIAPGTICQNSMESESGVAAVPKTNPWGSPAVGPPISQSFKDVMSEELAKELQEAEDVKTKEKQNSRYLYFCCK